MVRESNEFKQNDAVASPGAAGSVRGPEPVAIIMRTTGNVI